MRFVNAKMEVCIRAKALDRAEQVCEKVSAFVYTKSVFRM